jgi:hypothetical protein
MNDRVQIKHPGGRNTGSHAVPVPFVAAGTARGTAIAGVQGELRLLDANDHPTGPIIYGTQWYFVPKPSGNDWFRWMMVFRNAAGQPVINQGSYQLEVFGVDAQNPPQRIPGCQKLLKKFEVKASRFVTIDYPEEGATITGDERNYFVAYGTSNRPILFATVEDGNSTVDNAECNYFDQTINFYGSQFGPLNSTGAAVLTVVNYPDAVTNVSDVAQRNITVS